MKRSTQLKKNLFEMVYKWGGFGIQVDHTSTAFNEVLAEYIKVKDEEAWEEGDAKAQEEREMALQATA